MQTCLLPPARKMLSTSYSFTDISQTYTNEHAMDVSNMSDLMSAVLSAQGTLDCPHYSTLCGSPVAADACESGTFSFAPLEPAAATTSEQLGGEVVGLDGKPLRIAVFQPQSFSELSPDMEEHFTKRICELGKCVQTIGHDQVKYRQAIDMWKSIYGNVLTHFGASDPCHRYSDKFFEYFGIWAERMNTTVHPYEPCIGKSLLRAMDFSKLQGRARTYVQHNPVYLSICQVMSRIFPSIATLEQDNLSATVI